MTRDRLAVRVLLAVLLVALSGGCSAKVVRFYDGPVRAAGEVARVHNSFGMVITRVDGKAIERAPDGVVELPPGEHRIWVTYEADGGYGYSATHGRVLVRHRSYNMTTYRCSFDAGVDYAFLALTAGLDEGMGDVRRGPITGASWTAALVVKGTERIVAIPEVDFARPANRAASRPVTGGGAMVCGVARVPIPGTRDGYVTAAGRHVVMVPKTRETEQWVARTIASARATLSLPPGEPPVVKRQGRRVMGYGVGQFEFHDVPPGEYLLLFRTNAMDRAQVASAEVVVPPNVALVDDVYLLSPIPKDR